MKVDDIREIAKKHDLKPGKMKKADLVRAIQEAEKNTPCFETGTAMVCGQNHCRWREDCN